MGVPNGLIWPYTERYLARTVSFWELMPVFLAVGAAGELAIRRFRRWRGLATKRWW